jgi:hypothetical protein
MINWQITAKTIYCDAVDDEVTVIVYKNGTARCTGFRKYNKPNSFTSHIIKEKTSKLKKTIKCEGESCARTTGYRETILNEDT